MNFIRIRKNPAIYFFTGEFGRGPSRSSLSVKPCWSQCMLYSVRSVVHATMCFVARRPERAPDRLKVEKISKFSLLAAARVIRRQRSRTQTPGCRSGARKRRRLDGHASAPPFIIRFCLSLPRRSKTWDWTTASSSAEGQ